MKIEPESDITNVQQPLCIEAWDQASFRQIGFVSLYALNSVSRSLRQANSPSSYSKSPLRYPGGKSRAVSQILPLLPAKPGALVSPFLGGGSVELAAAALGWHVSGFDANGALVDFWKSL